MLHEVNISELECNPFNLVGKDWALITAGDETGCNTMTASWGNMGVLWSRNVVTVFVRPQRYTDKFMKSFDNFTVSFYEEDMRDALKLCGTKSGRDCDKIKEAGLTPVHENGTTYFKEAKLVFECRKLYMDKIKDENFIDTAVRDSCYPEKDYHYVYVGEVTRVLSK